MGPKRTHREKAGLGGFASLGSAFNQRGEPVDPVFGAGHGGKKGGKAKTPEGTK